MSSRHCDARRSEEVRSHPICSRDPPAPSRRGPPQHLGVVGDALAGNHPARSRVRHGRPRSPRKGGSRQAITRASTTRASCGSSDDEPTSSFVEGSTSPPSRWSCAATSPRCRRRRRVRRRHRRGRRGGHVRGRTSGCDADLPRRAGLGATQRGRLRRTPTRRRRGCAPAHAAREARSSRVDRRRTGQVEGRHERRSGARLARSGTGGEPPAAQQCGGPEMSAAAEPGATVGSPRSGPHTHPPAKVLRPGPRPPSARCAAARRPRHE